MTIDELKKQVEEMQSSIQQTRTDLDYAENNLDDLESYASSGRDNISDCKVSVNALDDELEEMKAHLDNSAGFDVEAVRKAVKEEIISELTNLLSDLLTDGLKKAPAKKSTETDNQ